MPRVSVILTCFDLGAFLDEAVASVRAQTFRDLELVVVDDGSCDPFTLERLEALSRDGVEVLRTPNRGLPAARNAGIRATRGEIVCCVDADDVLEPTLLERSLAALDADPGLAFASHWLRAFGDEEWDWTPRSCDFPALLDVNTVNGAAPVRRSALNDLGPDGPFEESMSEGCEDWDLWISLVERGHRGTILPEFLFRYRRRADSMSRIMNAGASHPAMYRRIVERHQATFRHHLRDLWLRRAGVVADHLRHGEEMRVELQEVLEPRLGAERERYRRLRDRMDEAHERERTAAALAAARHDLEALRASASWRLTAPLRALHRLLPGRTRGR